MDESTFEGEEGSIHISAAGEIGSGHKKIWTRDFLWDIAGTASTPQTEATRYLITLFRELERLRPNVCGAMSHGIAWDDKRECLVLLINLGDFVYAHRLRPDALTNHPLATAASLVTKVEPEIRKEDADLIMFKR